MVKKFNFTQGLISTSEQVVITIPMMREFNPDKAYAILTFDGKLQGCSLKSKSLTGDELKVSQVQTGNIYVCEVDVQEMQGYNVEEESPDKRSAAGGNSAIPAVRFWASLPKIEGENNAIDRNFKNYLQDSNLQFTLIFKNPLTGG